VSWPCQEGTSDPLQKFFGEGSVRANYQALTDEDANGQTLAWHWNWNKNYKACLPGTSPDLKIDAEFVPMMYVSGLSTSLNKA